MNYREKDKKNSHSLKIFSPRYITTISINERDEILLLLNTDLLYILLFLNIHGNLSEGCLNYDFLAHSCQLHILQFKTVKHSCCKSSLLITHLSVKLNIIAPYCCP